MKPGDAGDGGKLKRIVRIARRLGVGALAGAVVLSALFFVELLGASLEFMGFSDARATSLIVHRYRAQIIADQARILLGYAFLGGILGALSEAWFQWLDATPRRSTPLIVRVARSAAAVLAVHLYALLRSLLTYPQLYCEAFFDRGGRRRAVMLALTDHLSPRIVDAFAVVCLLAAVTAAAASRRGRAALSRVWLRGGALWPRRRWTAAATLPVLVLVLALLFQGRGHGRVQNARPNLLILAVDSLRADRLFDDGKAAWFPALRRLASQGVRFREAHVTVARTFPSWVTLLTGRYPHHHGVRHMFPSAAARNAIGPTLPARLREAGYETEVVSDYAGEIFSRTPFGFSHVEAPRFDIATIVGQRGLQVHPNILPYAAGAIGRRFFPALDAAPEWSDPSVLAERAIVRLGKLASRPFFLTVFFSAPHFPYAAPHPYYRRFTDPKYQGPFRFQKPPLSTVPVTDADARQIRGLYDGAVAATDAAIQRVLDRLVQLGLGENTVVVLLADHGENLYDVVGRGMGHGDHLRGGAADHVPLILVDPVHKFPAHDVAGIVRDVDLAPTLGGLLGCTSLPSDGEDLRPLLAGVRPTLELSAFSESEFWFTQKGPGFEPDERLPYPGITEVTEIAPDGDIYLKPEWEELVTAAKHRAVRTAEWKLLYRPTRDGVRWSLYHVASDSDELDDVLAKYPDVAAALRRRLQEWMTSDGRTVLRGGFAVPP